MAVFDEISGAQKESWEHLGEQNPWKKSQEHPSGAQNNKNISQERFSRIVENLSQFQGLNEAL